MTNSIHRAIAEGVILGMGNPLLDISATVTPDVLEKYGLEANNAILAEEKHMPLYGELVSQYHAEFTAGGATQNSIRVAQWMLQTPNSTSFFGAVGADAFANTMTVCSKKDGVNVQYMSNQEVPTGTCAVVITDKNRSLVANLSAANTYKLGHLLAREQWAVVEKASIYYISGFFLTVSPESMEAIGKHALEHNKTLICNLSAPFLIEVPIFFERMKSVLPYVSVYFGSEVEAAALSKAMGWNTDDLTEIATHLAQTENKSARPRTVIITHGASPTLVVIADSSRVWSIKEYPVDYIKPEAILDTNGAGDALVGGFLAGMAEGVTVDQCIARGHYAARVIIQRSGCTFPEKPSFSDS
jgi:adenosine kinase